MHLLSELRSAASAAGNHRSRPSNRWRGDDPIVSEYRRKGYDLNAGMLFVRDGRVYHGSEAVHQLALLTWTSSSIFNRLTGVAFSSRRVARLAYPFLKLGRSLTLMMRGKPLIKAKD